MYIYKILGTISIDKLLDRVVGKIDSFSNLECYLIIIFLTSLIIEEKQI